ncbi:hypothetical protein GF380_00805, partial [Candidatus Uhrbacteria bacterium]|nr:hypothetical protein [Candidatus Uhrbacteria bacterium]MBD3283897.1 hypothetical protein [Candidatus Uhrbacteria bacterium]
MLRNVTTRRTGVNRFRYASIVAVFLLAAFFVFLPDTSALAQFSDANQQVQNVEQAAGVQTPNDLPTIIGRLINVFLGLLGIILVIIILYAGFLWMTAGGDSEKVVTAQKWIRNGIIGLLIIVAAFAITQFILGFFADGGFGGGVRGDGLVPGGGFSTAAGALGNGIIETHYPMRDAMDVARNTSIIITFKQPMKLDSIIADYNDNGTPEDRSDDDVTEGLNDAAIKIYRLDAGEEQALTSDRVRVRFTDDRRTFVFRPVEYLGSSTVEVDYKVALKPGLDGILIENGNPAFPD